MWGKLFDRLLWVPLRGLRNRGGAGYSLEKLFIDEYFASNSEYGDPGHLAHALRRQVASGDERNLFILDGLDEVSKRLDHNPDMLRFLEEELFNQTDVIFTSRPYGKLPDNVLRLETIGFYPD